MSNRAEPLRYGVAIAAALAIATLLLVSCTPTPAPDDAYPAPPEVAPGPDAGPTAYPPPVLTQKAELATDQAERAAKQGTAAAVGVAEPITPTNMVGYASDVLGLAFEYPAALGDAEFVIGAGDDGYGWAIRFSRFDAFGLAGRSVDFSEGRGGMHSDTLGFAQDENGEYLWRTVMSPDGQVIEVEEVLDLDGREIVLFRPEPFFGEPEEGVEYPLAALGNLVGERFPGYIVQNADDSRLPYDTFVAILRSIDVFEPTEEP